MTMYLVVDNSFNQANYADIIGRVYFDPPAYAGVKKLTHAEGKQITFGDYVRSVERTQNIATAQRVAGAFECLRVGALDLLEDWPMPELPAWLANLTYSDDSVAH